MPGQTLTIHEGQEEPVNDRRRRFLVRRKAAEEEIRTLGQCAPGMRVERQLQTAFDGEPHQFGAGLQAQLFHDQTAVHLDGFFR